MIGARALIAQLGRGFGYEIIRQRGSHVRIRTLERGEHSISVPNHSPLRVGTLAGIITDVAQHFGIDEEAVLRTIRGRAR
ncbi:MAG TPA: type II toxin-antitoxin system HicA family toxin [Candidatus Krumholzibacteria bacterium]